MTHDRDDDAPLDSATLRALKDSDDLVPTSEAEVRRAEQALPDDIELPESLRSYRPRLAEGPSNVRWLPSKPRVASHVLAVTLGALAAAGAVLWFRPAGPPPVTSAGGDLVPSPTTSSSARLPLTFETRCERECCAGSACKTASFALRTCPSGIRCAGCTVDNVNGGPYRLRVGTVIPSELGQKVLPLDEPLELCLTALGGAETCLPALGDSGGETWRQLGQVTPLQSLLGGLTAELRVKGQAFPLANWRNAVSPTPDTLCKGVAIQLNDGKETLGRLSIFVEPTHFVELARAVSSPELLAKLGRFDVTGLEPRVRESSRGGGERFVLAIGPLDKADAEALRWHVLDLGIDATVSHGLDFIGSPRPLHP
jgi:hypothetical protein